MRIVLEQLRKLQRRVTGYRDDHGVTECFVCSATVPDGTWTPIGNGEYVCSRGCYTKCCHENGNLITAP